MIYKLALSKTINRINEDLLLFNNTKLNYFNHFHI